MTRLLLAAALLLLAACAPPRPPTALRQAVEAELGEPARAALFQAVDLNRDGVADWLVDYGRTGTMDWCGTGGCRMQIYASAPAGPRLVFDGEARRHRLSRGVLDLEIYGDFCGLAGAAPCERRYIWNRSRGAFEEAPNARGETLLGGYMFQPFVQLAAAPRLAEGPYPSDLYSVPDLDGDGERDWVRVARPCDPASMAASGVQVFSGDTLLLDAKARDYAIDVSTRPARLSLRPGPCGDDERCERRVYAWDAAAGRLVPEPRR